MKKNIFCIISVLVMCILGDTAFANEELVYSIANSDKTLWNCETEFVYTGKEWIANTAYGDYYDFNQGNNVNTYFNICTGQTVLLGNDFLDDTLRRHKKPTGYIFKWIGDGYLASYTNVNLMWDVPGIYKYPEEGEVYTVANDFSRVNGNYKTPGLVIDATYIEGIYYILIPRGYGKKAVLYYSEDLINWIEFGETGCIPLSYNNASKGIFPLYKARNRVYRDSTIVDAYEVYTTQNGYISNKILYESLNAAKILGCDQYIFTYRDDKLYCSKDGVYWISINIDSGSVKNLNMVYNYKDEKIIFNIENKQNDNINLVFDKKQLYNHIEGRLLNTDCYIQLGEKLLGFDQPPIIEEGRTLVPMRFLFEQMGAAVDWNSETQTATATLDNTAVTFSVNDTEAEVNSQPVTMDVPARLINGKTMVPLRFLSEELGYIVTWDDESRTAVIE